MTDVTAVSNNFDGSDRCGDENICEAHDRSDERFNFSSADFSNVDESSSFDLSAVQAVAMVCVLEDFLDKFAIVAGVDDFPQAVHVDAAHKTLETKCEEEDCAEERLQSDASLDKLNKLHFAKIRAFYAAIGFEILENLKNRNSFKCLLKHARVYESTSAEEQTLIRTEQANRQRLTKLRTLLATERQSFENSLQVKFEELGALKDKVEDMIVYNKVTAKYVEAWEYARSEQNTLKLNARTEKLQNETDKWKMKIEREHRITQEIMGCLRQIIEDHKSSIAHWKTQLQMEIERRDSEITKLKERRAQQFASLQTLTIMHQQHKQEIDEYLDYKEEKRRQALISENRNVAAVKIQAWWRGIMVRHKLGEFNPRRQKKGKKAGKDKNGKKKK